MLCLNMYMQFWCGIHSYIKTNSQNLFGTRFAKSLCRANPKKWWKRMIHPKTQIVGRIDFFCRRKNIYRIFEKQWAELELFFSIVILQFISGHWLFRLPLNSLSFCLFWSLTCSFRLVNLNFVFFKNSPIIFCILLLLPLTNFQHKYVYSFQ